MSLQLRRFFTGPILFFVSFRTILLRQAVSGANSLLLVTKWDFRGGMLAFSFLSTPQREEEVSGAITLGRLEQVLLGMALGLQDVLGTNGL
jgi:hypothetical protein